jgi:transcription elongation factor Elf1
MTYRALRKLCFGINGNTFLPEIKKELPQYDQREFGEYCFRKINDDKEIDEPKLISFYQSVLKTDHVKNNLALPQNVFDEVAVQKFESKQDFQITLEKCCYAKKQIISEALKKEILEKYNAQIFKITSLDLQREEQNNLKAHTRIWKRFWTTENEEQNYNLRLNPEISIIWRAAKQTRIEKYGKGSKLYDPAKRNRYLQEQYTLCTTVTDNALKNEITFAFEDAKKKGAEIDRFNDKINQTLRKDLNKNKLWFYGIDAGEIELATLALMNKDKKPQLFTVYELNQLDFSKQGYIYNKERELVIRDKPYKAIQNLSYFLNEELYEKTFRDGRFKETYSELFKEKQVSSIDLTTAKVIKGKIISNGDIITFFNLKILHAQRKIYQALITNPQAALKEKDYVLYFDKEGTEEVTKIYQSRLDFESIKPYQEIRNCLFAYFAGQQKNEAREEEQINQTRRALVGNMTGVIYYLYQKYPGIISIEDLEQTKVESDRKKFEGNIERPLEWALYRKFQQEGYVPPISELIKLRKLEDTAQKKSKKEVVDEGLKQFGIIKFVSEKDTSLTCPFCNEKAYANSSDDLNYKKDKNAKVFHCSKCDFHNITNPMGYESLDSNDKVAAFNIAKKGFEDMQKHT